MRKTGLVGVLTATLLSGCANAPGTGASPEASPLIPDRVLQITAKTAVTASQVVSLAAIAAVVHFVYDPLAPNWEIEETRLNDEVYRFSLKMKRHHTGGAGESMQILKRRASQLQYENGFAGYQLLEYSEGIDSQTLGARRIAEGTIKLVQRNTADSFMLNQAP